MRILLVTDAWSPQVNGVVRTLQRLRQECEGLGHEVEVIAPAQFRTLPCPTYPEIRLALRPGSTIARRIHRFRPHAVHIATEGPLGLAARRYCVRHRIPFTTSYHTRFPEYLHARLPVPLSLGYAYMRWFHKPSRAVMVATQTMRDELGAHGFHNVRPWSRGVDTGLFHPGHEPAIDLPKPVFLYVGRVAVEKNLEAFLDVPLGEGSKLVVGGGPELKRLRAKHPEVRFVGARHGVDLARHYVCGDVFVFPSKTDTFGLVLLEALASGCPVAAYPVAGPVDLIAGSGCGVLDEDLGRAMTRAMSIPREQCQAYAGQFSWRRCAEQFLSHLHRIELVAPVPGSIASGDRRGPETHESRGRRL